MNNNLGERLFFHIEKHIGRISSSWKLNNAEENIQIVKFLNTPTKSVSTFITLGVSNHILTMPSGATCRQEFLFSAYDKFDPESIAMMMILFSNQIISSHKAVLRGEITNLNQPISADINMKYLYTSIPYIFPEEFDQLLSVKPAVMFPLLIPLHEEEAQFVSEFGRQNFEKLIDEKEMDLFDLARLTIT